MTERRFSLAIEKKETELHNQPVLAFLVDSQALRKSVSLPAIDKARTLPPRRCLICDLNTINNELQHQCVEFGCKLFVPRSFGAERNHHRRSLVALRFLMPKAAEDVPMFQQNSEEALNEA